MLVSYRTLARPRPIYQKEASFWLGTHPRNASTARRTQAHERFACSSSISTWQYAQQAATSVTSEAQINCIAAPTRNLAIIWNRYQANANIAMPRRRACTTAAALVTTAIVATAPTCSHALVSPRQSLVGRARAVSGRRRRWAPALRRRGGGDDDDDEDEEEDDDNEEEEEEEDVVFVSRKKTRRRRALEPFCAFGCDDMC